MSINENGREYLSFVLEKLKERIAEVSSRIAEGQKDIEGMHDYYWENYTEMDQYGYENYDNQQALFRQISDNEEQLALKQRFRKMLDSPFFGRVDFLYEGEDEPDIFYIGIANFAERAGSMPLVYDWRAPVSGLFYDYDKGPASYQAPAGEISGEVTAKWQYKIRNGRMRYEFESDVKIDDEILMAELGKNGEIQLKNIVRTIQKEQNAIIRNTKDKILVIQGAAGSGKTSVALHRIAYLLYHDRNNLKSSNILVLTPNGVFADYISHILPELGEENIREMSFDIFAYKQLQDVAADCEDRYDEVERRIKFPHLASGTAYKQSEKFLGKMEGFLAELEDSLMNFRQIEYRGFTKKESEIIDLFYFRLPDLPLLARMDAVADYFIDEVETLCGNDLPDEERQAIRDKFQRMYETTDIYKIYNWFLEEQGLEMLPDKPLEQRCLKYEDVYPVLYLKYRLKGKQGQDNIKHLVVDEMQDYSRLQYEILKMLFSCRMTILGDRAQTMDDAPQDVLKFLPGIYGKNIRQIEMKKSYRNTVEIASYANNLAGLMDVELFQRHGAPVEEEDCSTMQEACEKAAGLLRIGENAYETAAVILRSEQEAEKAYFLLKERLEAAGYPTEKLLHYLDRDSTSFGKGLTVTTFYLAKGLEFDQVFCIFPKKDQTPLARQGRYIGATRALHELHMYEIL